MTSTDWLAIYGALLGTALAAWDVAKYLQERAKLRLSCYLAEEYTPGVDYVPGEVVVVIPFGSKLGEAAKKPEEVRQELARLTSSISLVTDPVRLATTTNNAKVCGGWLVRFRVDPNTPLTLPCISST